MATLIIDRWSSSCDECRKSANPNELGHYTVLGYGPQNGSAGCGERWTRWTNYYWKTQDDIDNILRLFPHLETIPGPRI